MEIVTVLREEAFRAIQRGDSDAHNAMLMEEIERLSSRVDVIVMAQLSMSALAPHLTNASIPVYNSGTTGFGRIREMLGVSATA